MIKVKYSDGQELDIFTNAEFISFAIDQLGEWYDCEIIYKRPKR